MSKYTGPSPAIDLNMEDIAKALTNAKAKKVEVKKRIEDFHRDMEYLKAEQRALEAVMEYQERHGKREKYDSHLGDDYGSQNPFNEKTLKHVSERLAIVKTLLSQSNATEEKLQKLARVVDADIISLEVVQAFPFRKKIVAEI